MAGHTPHERPDRPSRRQVLSALGTAGILSTTGCVTGMSDPGSTALSITGTRRGIEVTVTNSDIETVNLIDPSEEAVGSQDLVTGASTVSFQLLSARGSGYEPGSYTVVGVSGEDTIASTTVNIEPDVEIIDVFTAEERPDYDWLGQDAGEAWKFWGGVELENSGTGPEYVTEIVAQNPPPNAFENEPLSFGEGTFLGPDETAVIRQNDDIVNPALFHPPSGSSCRNETPTTIEMTVTASTKAGSPPTWSRSYRYTERQNAGYGDCNVEPVDGENNAARL